MKREAKKVSMKPIKIVVERHADGYVAYPLGFNGVVIGQGDTFDQALADARSAARFHVESFGDDAFAEQHEVLEAFIAEARVGA